MEDEPTQEVRRLKLCIAYDGAPWHGWQTLPSGETVQDQIERALRTITDRPVRIQGSGRTDTGVHALGQIAHVDIPASSRMTEAAWPDALNAVMPPSIRILSAEFVPITFHARYDARAKVYRYRIWRRKVMSPFEAGRVWHVYGDLDIRAVRECAVHLVGTYNFARLSANRGHTSEEQRREKPKDMTRTLNRVEVIKTDDTLEIEIEGNGFLYKMVRLIVGSLIHVARGRESAAWFCSLIDEPEGIKSHRMAPADGLYLVEVKY